MHLTVRRQRFAYKRAFRISGHVFTETEVIVAELHDGEHVGRGEAAGVYYLNDDATAMLTAVESVRQAVESGSDRADLQSLLPPGGARNALDCAYWDLESKQARVPVWRLAGVPEPRPLRTTLTLGADAPEAMARDAANIDTLKLKLTGESALDAERIAAVRAAMPNAWIGVDANQGYTAVDLPRLFEVLVANRVELLEQPLARGCEGGLDDLPRPVPVAADESAVSLNDIDALVGRFDVVNIKLDKCGGLTEGLAIAARARALGLQVMVGNMMGSSLSMAPSFVLGQLCDIVDLDGPTFLADDVEPAVEYERDRIWCPPNLWGWAGSALTTTAW